MAVTAFVVLVLLAPGATAIARTKPVVCPPGRFVLLDRLPLADAEAIEIDARTVAIVGACEPRRAAQLKAGRRFTRVVARWPACDDAAGRATLDVRIASPACDAMDGTFTAGRRRQRVPVHAVRSSCGDGIFDPGGDEECDANLGCEAGELCASSICLCEQVSSTTTPTTTTTTTTCASNPSCTPTPTTCDDGGTTRPAVLPRVGDLVITEVMPKPASVDDASGEWFEVLVNRDVDLTALALDRPGDPLAPDRVGSAACHRASAGTHLVFARSADDTLNGGLPPVDGLFTFSLPTGSGGTPGEVQLLSGTTVLDRFAWTAARAGKALQLDQDFTRPADNDLAANICDAITGYGTGDLGTPGAPNTTCTFVSPGSCLAGGTARLIVSPMPAQLVLTEWMPDPSLVGDGAGEWFEVRATAPVDLNGLRAGSSILAPTPIVPAGGACVRIPAGAFALFARTASETTNGMLPPVTGTFGFSLAQNQGTLKIGVDGVTLDTKTWAAAVPGRSIMTDSDGTQCSAPAGTPTYNGVDFGSPRTGNSSAECP